MIAHVFGEIAEKFNSSVVVDVSGIGYEIQLSSSDFEAVMVGSSQKFYTYHHVREQSQDLFGFSSLIAKKLFEMLITVQGVGPKAALSILSVGEVEDVRNAIALGDSVYLSKATGVGKKTAERVVVDLSDKVGLATKAPSQSGASQNGICDDALEALMALGYSMNDAMKALEKISNDLPTAARVTQALKVGL